MPICARAAAVGRVRLALATFALASLAGTAGAQIASPVVNISPIRSDRDASDPNSASGGRVNGLAAHPTNDRIYFAASEWGGLFQTGDRGRTWTYVQGHVPQVTWDVDFHPTDPNVIIATSFFDGKSRPLSGINVSRDGGRTWRVPRDARPAAGDCLLPGAMEEPAAFGISFNRENPNNVYVGTNCGLAISNDGGVSWDFVDPTPGDGGGLNVDDVVVHHGGIIDVCGDDGHQRSTDGGATFVAGAAEAGGRCSIAASPDEANVLFMAVGTQIFESRNGGASWPTTFTNPAPQGRIPFLAVNDRAGEAFDLWYGDIRLFRAGCITPANRNSPAQRCPASSGWAAAQTGAHADAGDLVFDPNDGINACPVIYSNDGGVYFNERSGSDCHDPRWEQPTRSVTALWLWDMDGNTRLTPSEEGVYIGQQDTGGFGTRDAPALAPGWRSPECCDIFDVEAEPARVVYTVCCFNVGRATRMFLDDDSMDGGGEIPNYPAGSLVGFRDTDSLSNYAANSYALVTSGGVFFTTNVGASPINWQSLGTNAPAGICGIYSSRRRDGTPVFTARVGGCGLGQTGALWQHVGATTTGDWTRIGRNGASAFGAFGVNPADPQHIIANDRSGPTPQMVRTFNGGATWAPLPQLDSMLTGHGDFIGVTRRGARPGDAGYPQASLVAINPTDPDMVVAAGQDSGVFLSLDGGNSWRLVTDPRTNNALRPHLSRPLFAHFESFFNGHVNLFIGARGRGAWRVVVNRPTFVADSRFDADNIGDVAIGSPWGIGTIERSGTSFTALALQPNGTRFDGWLLNTHDNRLEGVGDLNRDGRSEMIFASPWGVGVLHLTGTSYGARMLAPNGTRFGGWLLNTHDNRFGPVGDFDGDGRDEVMVSSPWGIGVFNIDGGTISTPALQPNGTRFDGWLLNTADNRFGPVGDFNGDGRDDMLVRSPWGIGILNLSGTTFSGLMLRPNGTNFGGWRLDTNSDHSWGASNFGAANRDELFVAGNDGIAVLRFDAANKTFTTTARGANGQRLGGWLLSTRDNHFDGFRDLTGDGRANILVSSPWGIGILEQSGGVLTAPVMAQNGTRFDGWLLNTMDNKFW